MRTNDYDTNYLTRLGQNPDPCLILFCFVGCRPPYKVQSQLPLRPRKSSSKCLEPMFDGNDAVTAAVDQGPAWNDKCSEVQSKQRCSTPVGDGANEFHFPPVSKLL